MLRLTKRRSTVLRRLGLVQLKSGSRTKMTSPRPSPVTSELHQSLNDNDCNTTQHNATQHVETLENTLKTLKHEER